MKNILIILGIILLTHQTFLTAQDDTMRIVEVTEKLERALSVLEEEYIEILDFQKIVDDAIENTLRKLDPYSVYLPPKKYKQVNDPLIGNFEGIGIQFYILRDTLLVTSVIKNGPAKKAGLWSGDKIIKVDGKNMANIKLKNLDVTKALKGPKGSKVKLKIKRAGEKKLLDFTITRGKVPLYSIETAYMLNSTIGYMKIKRFSATTMREFHQVLSKLRAKGMKDLILDLKGNGGGYLSVAVAMADEFLEENNLIVYTEGRKYSKKGYKATAKGCFESGKLVILTDEGTASASEIVSGAVQDWDRGLVVGRRSVGKGSVQKPFMLPDSSFMRVTVAKYYTPSGRSIQKSTDKNIIACYKAMTQEQGEINKLPDSLRYCTKIKQRTVYGGGGIMPDIYVKKDTIHELNYFKAIQKKGIINTFIIKYVDEHRLYWKTKYSDVDSFDKNFAVGEETLAELSLYAAEKGLVFNAKEYGQAKEHLKIVVKAYIARYLWGIGAYYQIYNQIDPIFQKGLQSLQDDTFSQMNIVVN